MATCPVGHPNPPQWEFCGECGALLEREAEPPSYSPWYRTMSAILALITFTAVLIAVGVVALTDTTRSGQLRSSWSTTAGAVAIQEWWSGAYEPFAELQDALDDSRRALERLDRPRFEAACQRIEDAAAVALPAHLPTPDPVLTSELVAATTDAHAAAHMCLSLAAGSVNSYDGEFAANVDQADKHLAAAQGYINKALAGTL